jgi:CubicO group peptidase (beta-lactamase class C family)
MRSVPLPLTDPDSARGADRLTFAASVDRSGTVEAPSSDACVPWWSFTKTLVAAAVMRLAQRGALTLDAPLSGKPFSVRQLLQNRAGVGNYGRLDAYRRAVARNEDPWSVEMLLDRADADTLLFPPGAGWAYSNVGYLMLKQVVEDATGDFLDVALRELVLDPLGLAAARVAASRADMATTAFPGGRIYHPGWVYHGLVIGPVAEAALALHRLFATDLLSDASRDAMLMPHPLGGPLPGRPWVTTGYGLGLMIGTAASDGAPAPIPVFGHSAAGPGSVGAVYGWHGPDGLRTAAVFSDDADEARPEHLAVRRLLAPDANQAG